MAITPKNKLIRDKIPQSIIDQGRTPNITILDNERFKREIFNKLLDESKEVVDSMDNSEHLAEEIADVLEVLDSIIKLEKLDKSQIEKIKREKREMWGGFDNKIYLDSTTEKD